MSLAGLFIQYICEFHCIFLYDYDDFKVNYIV